MDTSTGQRSAIIVLIMNGAPKRRSRWRLAWGFVNEAFIESIKKAIVACQIALSGSLDLRNKQICFSEKLLFSDCRQALRPDMKGAADIWNPWRRLWGGLSQSCRVSGDHADARRQLRSKAAISVLVFILWMSSC
jgi:hypothetical protein